MNIRIEDIIEQIDGISLSTNFKGAEHYGLSSEELSWFRRRFFNFKNYLIDMLNAVINNEFDWLIIEPKHRFVDLVLIYSLLDFFYYIGEKEYDVADFTMDGQQNGWLHVLDAVFGELLGDIYDEISPQQRD